MLYSNLLSQREATECPTVCMFILLYSHCTKVLTVWYKKIGLLEIPQCDHLGALPYFFCVREKCIWRKAVQFYDTQVKTFPYYVDHHHALASRCCMQPAPSRLLLVLVAAGVWLWERGMRKEGFTPLCWLLAVRLECHGLAIAVWEYVSGEKIQSMVLWVLL